MHLQASVGNIQLPPIYWLCISYRTNVIRRRNRGHLHFMNSFNYSYFRIWPWKSMVKFLGVVQVQGHKVGPTTGKFGKHSNFGVEKKLNMQHAFRNWLLRCVNKEWIRQVMWKIQSWHDFAHRRTGGRTATMIPPSTSMTRGYHKYKLGPVSLQIHGGRSTSIFVVFMVHDKFVGMISFTLISKEYHTTSCPHISSGQVNFQFSWAGFSIQTRMQTGFL